MLSLKTQFAHSLRIVVPALLALALAGLAASGALAHGAGRAAGGPGQIVFVAGKAEHCYMGACKNFDLVRSISPHGGRGQVLAKVRSAVETASTEDGTVAVLSKNVAGGGANSNAFTQVYLIAPSGKRKAVFSHRLQGFNATGLGISGDGKLLAVSGRYTGGSSESSKIWIVHSDGTGLRQLTTESGSDETPTISPDGRRIVFARTTHDGTPAGRKPELYVVDVAGGKPVRLTENTVEDVNPVFSPDGQSIAFGQDTGGSRNTVDVVRVDGSGLRTVTSTGGTYPDPDYSPNGRNLVFVGEIPHARGYDTAIYTVRTSGAGRKPVSSRFEDAGLPQWTLRREIP
jgi:dipeptidyl aminopeptidase/acylaminoacyl peptidase